MHAASLRSQKLRMLLTHRKLLRSKAIAIDNDLRGTLRNFGLEVGMVGTVKFEARIKELVDNLPDLAVLGFNCLPVFFLVIVRDYFASRVNGQQPRSPKANNSKKTWRKQRGDFL
jgi:hypothetical protein